MLFLLISVLYLLIGTFIARRDYAVRLDAVSDTPKVLESEKAKMNAIRHHNNCWLGGAYEENYRTKRCDCSKADKFNPIRQRVINLEDMDINGPYTMLFFYPAIGFHRFLTNGTVSHKGYDHELTKRLEAEVGMPPLQELS